MYQVEYTDEKNNRYTLITANSIEAIRTQRNAQKRGYAVSRYLLKEKNASVVVERRLCK